MKKTIVFLSLMLALEGLGMQAALGEEKQPEVEKEIWALEQTYLANHQHANHQQIIPMWHDQFLGWPDDEPKPTGIKAVTLRLRRRYPVPAAWTFTIEPGGIRVIGNVAINFYTIHFLTKDDAGQEQKRSRRVTHTWIKEGSRWKILGGMSKQQ